MKVEVEETGGDFLERIKELPSREDRKGIIIKKEQI